MDFRFWFPFVELGELFQNESILLELQLIHVVENVFDLVEIASMHNQDVHFGLCENGFGSLVQFTEQDFLAEAVPFFLSFGEHAVSTIGVLPFGKDGF